MTALVEGVIHEGGIDLDDAYGKAMSLALAHEVVSAREDFHRFAQFCIQDEHGGSIVQESLHRVIHLHVETCWWAGLHAGLLAPFGHGKTIQLPVGRTCWELGRDQSLRCKIISNNDGKAMERVMGCTALMFSPAYRLVFPHIKPVPAEVAKKQRKQAKMTQHEVYLDRPGFALDPSIQAAGVTSGGTGGRADFMVFDDVCDQKNSLDEPITREKVYANIENVWLQRCTPAARVMYLGTAWHQADATHRLIDNPLWSFLVAAISDDFKRIDLKVYNPPDDYPIPRLAASPTAASNRAAHGWVQVRSSNVDQVHYDLERQELHVRFLGGGHYKYKEVPRSIYDQMLAAESVGGFMNQNVRGIFPHERVDADEGERYPGEAGARGRVKRFTEGGTP